MRVGALLRLTPREVRARLSPHELVEYKAWADVDGPWWGVRLDVLFARQQATTVAAAGVSDVSPDQFLVRWGRTAPAHVVPFEEVLPILRARFPGK